MSTIPPIPRVGADYLASPSYSQKMPKMSTILNSDEGDGSDNGGGSNGGGIPGPECPAGQHVDPTSGHCVPNQTASNCPAGQIWVSTLNGGHGGCTASCPEGKRPNMSTGACEDDPNAGIGGPSSGGTGGSGGSGSAVQPWNPQSKPYVFQPWTAPAKTPFELELEKQLQDFLWNWDKEVPYTPGVISNLKTNNFRNSFGRTNANRDAIEADAIQRGVLNSTGTDRRLDSARQAADSQFAAGDREIDNTSILANFQAQMTNRLAALDRAEAHMNAEREFLMQNEMNDFERQKGMATIALSYYSLEQQRWELTQQLNLSKSQFGATMDWNKILLQWNIINGLSPQGQAA